jgi:DNA-binding transcriptional LysR family regulator
MLKGNLNELLYFVTVAREGSFTRAASVLGLTQSALSQSVRGLEERLDIRLLTRTTRSVSLTSAGERLRDAIGHRFEEIESELEALTELRDKPAGTVRITAGDQVISSILMPKLAKLLQDYPDINIEFDVNYGFRDIVADRFDAGIRLGETLDKDMIAIPIGPKLSMAAVASPSYFERNGVPKHPHDLIEHNCINIRFPSSGGLYAWEFEQGDTSLNVQVTGQVTCNGTPHIIDAALRGLGLAFLPNNEVEPMLASGQLIRVLEDWCPPFDGYYLYYPSRRQPSPAFRLVLEALRVR